MPPVAVPNKLMPYLQAIVAIVIVSLFCVVMIGPMVGWNAADVDMKETLKAIMFILTGFLFGSAVSSGKKDDQNAALTSALIAAPAVPPTPPAPPAPEPAKAPAPAEVPVALPVDIDPTAAAAKT